jgi:hypothetical protein
VPQRQPLPIELEVKAAIEKLSPAARKKLTQFARRGAYQLTCAGEPIASDEHDQIVHDAIADTLSLAVPWDRRLKMELHLYYVIFRRISNPMCQRRLRQSLPDIFVPMGGEWSPTRAQAIPRSRSNGRPCEGRTRAA